MDLSERIRSVRLAKGLKQSDLAKSLNIEQSNYNRFERRGNKLTYEQIERIADALGVSVAELLSIQYSKDDKQTSGQQDRIGYLEKENERLKAENRELTKDVERLNETLGFVKAVMNWVNNDPKRVHQMENDLMNQRSKQALDDFRSGKGDE